MAKFDEDVPQDLREVWNILYEEVNSLQWRWLQYMQLFGTSQDIVDVLNRTASNFFVGLEDILLRDIQIAIARLGDPPSDARGNRNVSLPALLEIIDSMDHRNLSTQYRRALKDFMDASSAIRHRRNKWIAHFDLATQQAAVLTPLTHPSRREIHDSLEALYSAMNCVEGNLTGMETLYDGMYTSHDAETLVAILRSAPSLERQ